MYRYTGTTPGPKSWVTDAEYKVLSAEIKKEYIYEEDEQFDPFDEEESDYEGDDDDDDDDDDDID